MAVGKEILTKIRSVQNTQKITKAMQMVSTSKMRKTQERMRLARPYANKVRLVMSHLAQTQTDHGIKLLTEHKNSNRVGFILITTDKGLCGGLPKFKNTKNKVFKLKWFAWVAKVWQRVSVSV